METLLLGFDAREMCCDFQSTWSQERKDAYLFRQDIRKPLSTDTIVWPSQFDAGRSIECSQPGGAPIAQVDLSLPAWIGPNRPLWSDLDHLQTYLAAQPSTRTMPYWVVAIARLADGASTGSWPQLGTTTPSHIQPQWRLLGFDVADQYLLSGLSNCGHIPGTDDVLLLGRLWEPHLNDYHLFDNPGEAALFKEFSDARVPEHAPFFVYGIWLVQGSAPGSTRERRFVRFAP